MGTVGVSEDGGGQRKPFTLRQRKGQNEPGLMGQQAWSGPRG